MSSALEVKRDRAMEELTIAEADALIRHAQRMKEVLVLGLQCECLRLEDCLLLDEIGKGTRAWN